MLTVSAVFIRMKRLLPYPYTERISTCRSARKIHIINCPHAESGVNYRDITDDTHTWFCSHCGHKITSANAETGNCECG